MTTLDGRRVIVTGANGTFGRLLCGRLVASGATVVGLDLTAGEVELVYHEVISLGEARKGVGDGDLRRIVDRVRHADTVRL